MTGLRSLALAAALVASLPPSCAAQPPFRVLYTFGAYPDAQTPAGIVLGPHGVLYGAATYGGLFGDGAVFALTPPTASGEAWTESVLYSFALQNGDGLEPPRGPVMGPQGTIFGTGADIDSYGTVYQVTPPTESGGPWSETTLLRTEYGGGLYYINGVAAGSHGEAYAIAGNGGTYYYGAVVELTPPSVPGGEWAQSTIYSFPGEPDGNTPVGLIMGPNGVLYGTTNTGGSVGLGCVFELRPPVASGAPWTEKVLYSFLGTNDGFTDGAFPTLPPSMDSAGNLYGTTSQGGPADLGTVWELQPPAGDSTSAEKFWTETVLYDFAVSGQLPTSPLAVGDNALYGTTANANLSAGGGYLFELQPPANPGDFWTETVLYQFIGHSMPSSSLVLDGKGMLYGTANPGYSYGAPAGDGIVYRVETIQGGVR